MKALEFSNYFGKNRTPEKEFKRLLFIDWDKREWDRFYNYMFWSTFLYLRDGIIEMDNSKSILRKQIKQNYTADFLDWWLEYSSNGCNHSKSFSAEYNGFLNSYEIEKKDVKN